MLRFAIVEEIHAEGIWDQVLAEISHFPSKPQNLEIDIDLGEGCWTLERIRFSLHDEASYFVVRAVLSTFPSVTFLTEDGLKETVNNVTAGYAAAFIE